MNEEIMHILECAVIEEYSTWYKYGTPHLSQDHIDMYRLQLITYETLGLQSRNHALDIAYPIALLSTLPQGLEAFGKHWSYENGAS